jgi:hypothetical protein
MEAFRVSYGSRTRRVSHGSRTRRLFGKTLEKPFQKHLKASENFGTTLEYIGRHEKTNYHRNSLDNL